MAGAKKSAKKTARTPAKAARKPAKAARAASKPQGAKSAAPGLSGVVYTDVRRAAVAWQLGKLPS